MPTRSSSPPGPYKYSAVWVGVGRLLRDDVEGLQLAKPVVGENRPRFSAAVGRAHLRAFAPERVVFPPVMRGVFAQVRARAEVLEGVRRVRAHANAYGPIDAARRRPHAEVRIQTRRSRARRIRHARHDGTPVRRHRALSVCHTSSSLTKSVAREFARLAVVVLDQQQLGGRDRHGEEGAIRRVRRIRIEDKLGVELRAVILRRELLVRVAVGVVRVMGAPVLDGRDHAHKRCVPPASAPRSRSSPSTRRRRKTSSRPMSQACRHEIKLSKSGFVKRAANPGGPVALHTLSTATAVQGHSSSR